MRGLHYQLPPNAQGKLVRVGRGAKYSTSRSTSAAARRPSAAGSAKYCRLDNLRQLWVPEGFAHGFLTLSEQAEVLYKASAYYAPASERSLAWDDPALGIEWPAGNPAPSVSQGFADAPRLEAAEAFPLKANEEGGRRREHLQTCDL